VQPAPNLLVPTDEHPHDQHLQAILAEIEPSNLVFMENVHGFFENKKGILAVYAASAPAGVLEAVEIPTTSIVSADGTLFKAEWMQHGLRERGQPVESVAELFAAAEAVLPHFEAAMHAIGAQVGGSVEVKMAPGLKAEKRVVEKAADDYGGRNCGTVATPVVHAAVGWVFDVVRMKFMCGTAAEIQRVLAAVLAHPQVKVVLKGKNRFKHKTPNGFCDFMLQVVFEATVAGGGKTMVVRHNCEVQIHLRAVTEYAEAHESHKYYDYFREFFQGSMNTVAARLADMAKIVGEEAEAAEVAVASKEVLFARLVGNVVASGDVGRMDALANLCKDYLSEFALAVHVFDQVVAIEIETLGPDHPNVGATYNNMGLVLRKQGQLEAAMVRYEQAVAIKIKALGPDHPSVGDTCYNMAGLAKTRQNLPRALELFTRSRDIYLAAHGAEHAEVADANEEIARLTAAM